jgi:NAD(P)-dependent dehydrogenase (short-subunit alcohol dehydrogenase family)
VAIWDVDGTAGLAAAQTIENASSDVVDVTDAATIASALAAVETRLGPPDMPVNNAGSLDPTFRSPLIPPRNGGRSSKSI